MKTLNLCFVLVITVWACSRQTTADITPKTTTNDVGSVPKNEYSAAPPQKEPAPTQDTMGAVEADPAVNKVDLPVHQAQQDPAVVSEEDWLVWRTTTTGFETQWIRLSGDNVSVVAKRAALITTDGNRLWRVERRDRASKLLSCGCVESENAADCRPVAEVTLPGLVAVSVDTGAEIPLVTPQHEDMLGTDVAGALEVSGGVGSTLFIHSSQYGYFCGAHGSADTQFYLANLATEKMATEYREKLRNSLPRTVLQSAIDSIVATVRECEGDTVDPVAVEQNTSLDGFRVSLDEKGELRVTWELSHFVVYACSSDYAASALATSGLLPEAKVVGLDGPLPPNLLKVLRSFGPTNAVGWSKVNVTGDEKATMVQRFSTIKEGFWPNSAYSSTELTPPSKATVANAEILVEKGRKLTIAKDYSSAIAAFTEAIEANGGLALAWSGRGYARMLNGELEAASNDFDKAKEINQEPAFLGMVYFNIGQIAEKNGDKGAAKIAYQQSLKLRPNKHVEKALAKLNP